MTPQELTAAVRETTFTYEEAQDLINLLKEKQVRGHVHMTSAKIWVFQTFSIDMSFMLKNVPMSQLAQLEHYEVVAVD